MEAAHPEPLKKEEERRLAISKVVHGEWLKHQALKRQRESLNRKMATLENQIDRIERTKALHRGPINYAEEMIKYRIQKIRKKIFDEQVRLSRWHFVTSLSSIKFTAPPPPKKEKAAAAVVDQPKPEPAPESSQPAGVPEAEPAPDQG